MLKCYIVVFVLLFQLVNSYVLHAERNVAIQTLACRLLYDILPGLETAVVFQETVCTHRSWLCMAERFIGIVLNGPILVRNMVFLLIRILECFFLFQMYSLKFRMQALF